MYEVLGQDFTAKDANTRVHQDLVGCGHSSKPVSRSRSKAVPKAGSPCIRSLPHTSSPPHAIDKMREHKMSNMPYVTHFGSCQPQRQLFGQDPASPHCSQRYDAVGACSCLVADGLRPPKHMLHQSPPLCPSAPHTSHDEYEGLKFFRRN